MKSQTCTERAPIASILPPAGMFGAVLLSVMTMSYLLPSFTRHCPPTSGVFATFFAANGGRFAPFHCTLPTTVSRLVAAIAPTMALASRWGARLSASTATSNSACTKPIGCVHCFLVAASQLAARSFALMPVSDDLNGWFGDHHTSDERLLPSLPSASTATGNRIAFPIEATFGL